MPREYTSRLINRPSSFKLFSTRSQGYSARYVLAEVGSAGDVQGLLAHTCEHTAGFETRLVTLLSEVPGQDIGTERKADA